MNALIYVIENSCKWRRLPERFGNQYTIDTRVNRWAKAGVLERVFREMQSLCLISAKSSRCRSTAPRSRSTRTARALKKTVRIPSASPA
ncbi:MAG: transposase [Verrucomicrobiales bacterium]